MKIRPKLQGVRGCEIIVSEWLWSSMIDPSIQSLNSSRLFALSSLLTLWTSFQRCSNGDLRQSRINTSHWPGCIERHNCWWVRTAAHSGSSCRCVQELGRIPADQPRRLPGGNWSNQSSGSRCVCPAIRSPGERDAATREFVRLWQRGGHCRGIQYCHLIGRHHVWIPTLRCRCNRNQVVATR